MRDKKSLLILCLGLLLFLVFLSLLSLSLGDSRSGLMDVIDSFLGNADDSVFSIIVKARLPRILVSILAGASLALSGALLQTLTRNPLADSGILGINTGAGFVVTLMIVAFNVSSPSAIRFIPLYAMLGGCATIFLVYLLAYQPHRPIRPTRLVLGGVAVSTMISGFMIALMTTVNRQKVAYIVKWLGGTFGGDDWPTIRLVTPFLLILWLLVYSQSRTLNILGLNEQTAQGVGLPLKQARIIILALSTALAALSVVLAGNIGFIGLVAGHIGRRLAGGNHHFALPAIALIGSIILLIADSLIRIFFVGTGIPTGTLVSILGAPYFLYIMRKANR